MKKFNFSVNFLVLAVLLFSPTTSAWSQTIAYWNFNDGPSDNNVNWPSTVPADLGSANLSHNFANVVSFGGTGINGVESELAGGSFCPQGGEANSNNGKWLQLEVPALASGSITLSYASRRTSTGFTTHQIDYSTDGSTWTTLETIDISGWGNSWVAGQVVEVVFDGLPGMHNNADFSIRIVVDGASSTMGNTRFDNLRLEALEGYVSTEARLKAWTVGGVDVLDMEGLEVSDAGSEPGASLVVDDFTGFSGTLPEALSTSAEVELQVNGQAVAPEAWAQLTLSDGDVLVLTLTAEDPSFQKIYKLSLQQATFVEGLEISGQLYAFKQVEVGQRSDVQFYYLSGGGLTTPVLLEAPEGFLLSFDCDVAYASSLSINSSDFNQKRIFVRFAPGETKAYSGHIVHSVGAAETQVAVSGSGIASRIPDGYYDGIDGTGRALMQQLHHRINDHNVFTYSDIWNIFGDADLKFDGKVWDIYGTLECESSPYTYTLGEDQDRGTNVSEEGRFYNREHSWPVSWWGGSQTDTMYTDVHHIFPSDKLVNAQRGNQSFGEVAAPQWTSLNGSLLGPNVAGSTYNGLVFEPHDAYKGDLARTWFYMLTRYMHRSPGWSSQNLIPPILDGSSWPALEPWVLEMLLQWHEQDPVSQKERIRNHQIFLLQGNRNPYVDHPEWVVALFDQTTGLEQKAQTVFKVYPNPFKDGLYLQTDTTLPVRVEVFNAMGQRILAREWKGELLPAGDWPPGLYLMVLTRGTERQSIKLLK